MSNDLLFASQSTVDVARSCSQWRDNFPCIRGMSGVRLGYLSIMPICVAFLEPDEWNSYALASGATGPHWLKLKLRLRSGFACVHDFVVLETEWQL